MYFGNYCNNRLKGGLFPGDVDGELCSFSVVLVCTIGKNASKSMFFRSKTDLGGLGHREHTILLSRKRAMNSLLLSYFILLLLLSYFL